VVIPAIIAILGWANLLIGAIALAYSLYQAVIKGLKLAGKLKPTAKEIKLMEKERKMEHYYYHCECNSDGFRRLMIENFEKEAKEEIQKEAEILKRKQRNSRMQ
jgi:hypothetical protein